MDTMIADLVKDKRDQLKIIKKIALSISDKNKIDEVFSDVAKNIVRKLGSEDCVIYLLDENENVLIQKAAYGPKSGRIDLIKSPIKIPIKRGIPGKVVKTGRQVLLSEVSKSKDHLADESGRQSKITVPIIVGEEVLGVIDAEHTAKGFFTKDHLNMMETIASIIASKMLLLKAYGTLENQARDLRVINSQYRQSAFVITHDIRSPLANIQGLIDVYRLNKQKGKTEENEKIIELIQESVNKLTSKVDDLNKVISAVSEPSRTARIINFSNLLGSIKMGISMQIKNSQAEILEDFEEVKSIKYPRSYLESIMLNLITNAIKYRSPDRSPVIKLSTRRKDDFVVLSVADNGQGIDLEKHGDQLFQLFKRFNHKVEGRGLGLNIVKTQVESMGGKIKVSSTPGEGTTFEIFLKDLKENVK